MIRRLRRLWYCDLLRLHAELRMFRRPDERWAYQCSLCGKRWFEDEFSIDDLEGEE